MDEIRNPYGPGAGTPPPALVGREAELRAFAIKLERAKLGRPAKSLLATGLRGVGKTVLLNRFVEIAQQSGYRNAFMEASDGGSFVRLLAVHVRTLLFELDRLGALSEHVKRAMRVFQEFHRALRTRRRALVFDRRRSRARFGRQRRFGGRPHRVDGRAR